MLKNVCYMLPRPPLGMFAKMLQKCYINVTIMLVSFPQIKYFPQKQLREETPEYERNRLVCTTKKATASTGLFADAPLTVYATGWRCTGKMVCTYLHTGSTTATTGSDRIKRKYTQISTGSIQSRAYHVERPKVSAEYQ